MAFITVVPAIRTIPGVEEFDYRVDDGADIEVGDALRVPFRKQQIPSLVIRKSKTSVFAAKAIHIPQPEPLLRFGTTIATLLELSAAHSFTSKPSIVDAWIRDVPKRATTEPPQTLPAHQIGFQRREARLFVDRWYAPTGLVAEARASEGKTLILTPWQAHADEIAHELDAVALHAHVTPTEAWNAIADFVRGKSPILVSTRLGAWLAAVADTVLVDEPENDDFKQDELSPRLDARWIVQQAAAIRPDLSIISFATTSRLIVPHVSPDIPLELKTEPWQGRAKSPIDGLTSSTVNDIEAALEDGKPVTILHPVRGERASIRCRDCGWTAPCPSCGFPLSIVGVSALCRRCGKKSPPPESCPSCGGSDLSRGRPGVDRLTKQVAERFTSNVRIVNLSSLYDHALDANGLLVITDVSLIGGVAEDIRRKERLLISWRRIAARASLTNTRVIAQGPEELLTEITEWLASAGVEKTWKAERADRSAFGYPPINRLVKLIVSGPESAAANLMEEIERAKKADMSLRGPYPVAFRSASRGERHVLHLITPQTTKETDIITILDRFKKRAIIDLDPIAFFA